MDSILFFNVEYFRRGWKKKCREFTQSLHSAPSHVIIPFCYISCIPCLPCHRAPAYSWDITVSIAALMETDGQSRRQEHLNVTLSMAACSSSPAPGKDFPNVTNLLRYGSVSPAKLLQLCWLWSLTTMLHWGKVFPGKMLQSSSAPLRLPGKVVTFLLPSILRKKVSSNLIQEVYYKGRLQEDGCLCQGEKR